MTKKITLISLTLCIAFISALVFSGCEDDPTMPSVGQYFANNPYESAARATTDTTLTIFPESASVSHLGQAVSFRVAGGNNSTYTWTTAVAGNGTVTPAYPGSFDATYTTVTLNDNSVIVYDSDGRSAVATISVGGGIALAIVPNTRTLTVGSAANFSIVGGTGPYTVLSSIPGIGASPGVLGGNTFIYTATAVGSQTLTVIDNVGDTAVASVTQI